MRERGNCGVLPPHPWVAADLASGDRAPQGIGFVVLGGVTSILGDGRAASQGEATVLFVKGTLYAFTCFLPLSAAIVADF